MRILTTTTALEIEDHRPVVTALNRCLATCVDGEEAYETAAARVADASLRARLLRYAGERLGFTFALETWIMKLGGIPDVSTAVVYAREPMRTGPGPSRGALEACVLSERTSLVVYQTAISHAVVDTVSAPMRGMLETHYGEIHDALYEIERRLRAH
jgi:rubrerythrin